ncbi:hypothetical protein B0H15DRAFT_799469 [Mycena belliarum]|uniref:Uncharacterized protein n=1 Tax=Mycena belliarum TaxID=1033014 RepID=A0AAD6XQL9_9AGAR|nr:hypothetical protein B0H15DRAFT_799469 [Mycena belliae]
MTSTTTPHTSDGKPGIGAKIKGATQMVHGAGENLRGTLLGGVDTVAHQDSTRNDAVAARGRAEHAAGAARMTGDAMTFTPCGSIETAPRPPVPQLPQTQTQTGTGYSGASGAPANVPIPGTGMGPTSNTSAGAAAPPPKHAGYGATDELNQHAAAPPAGHTYPPLQHNHAFDEHAAVDAHTPFHDHAAAAERIPAYDGPGNDVQRRERPAGDAEPRRGLGRGRGRGSWTHEHCLASKTPGHTLFRSPGAPPNGAQRCSPAAGQRASALDEYSSVYDKPEL